MSAFLSRFLDQTDGVDLVTGHLDPPGVPPQAGLSRDADPADPAPLQAAALAPTTLPATPAAAPLAAPAQAAPIKAGLPTGSNDQLADYLVLGYWQDSGGAAAQWSAGKGGHLTVNLTALSPAAQQLARWALSAWSQACGITFTETTGKADIGFDQPKGVQAYTDTSSGFGGNLSGATVHISARWLTLYGTTIDSYGFQTFIHEIGHALGLGHQGPYNSTAVYPADAVYANDCWNESVMSYFSEDDNPTVAASYAYDITPMSADVVAVQSMYGPSTTANLGDSIYGKGANVGGYMQEVFDDWAAGTTSANYKGGPVALTICDSGGTDTLDFSFYTGRQVLNLTAESVSSVNGLTGNLSIGRGTVIENGMTGSGADVLTGNGAANVLQSGDGMDTVQGASGDDQILAGADAADKHDLAHGGAGNDTVNGGSGNDWVYGDDGADSLVAGQGADTLNGGTGNDTLLCGAWGDALFGGDGNDVLNGGLGHDQETGGAGADQFVHDLSDTLGGDWIADYSASQGDVLVFTGATASAQDFSVQTLSAGAGAPGVDEVEIVYTPTGQVIWTLVDGAAQAQIWVQSGGQSFDLLA